MKMLINFFPTSKEIWAAQFMKAIKMRSKQDFHPLIKNSWCILLSIRSGLKMQDRMEELWVYKDLKPRGLSDTQFN
jgi:hypothetical protein